MNSVEDVKIYSFSKLVKDFFFKSTLPDKFCHGNVCLYILHHNFCGMLSIDQSVHTSCFEMMKILSEKSY